MRADMCVAIYHHISVGFGLMKHGLHHMRPFRASSHLRTKAPARSASSTVLSVEVVIEYVNLRAGQSQERNWLTTLATVNSSL